MGVPGCGVGIGDGLAEDGLLAMGAASSLSLMYVLAGNFVLQVLHTGMGLQKMDRQTEHTNPTSTIFL